MNIKEYLKEYRKIHKTEIKQKQKEWYIKNKIKILIKVKNRYRKNRKSILKYKKEYGLKHRDRINKYLIEKRKINIEFRILCNLRKRLWKVLKQNSKKSRTLELLGCSIRQLREHLQSQFRPGMTWDNQGKWHIDHIRPCASFDMTRAEEQRACFNWQNLQPLWAKDNFEKSDKILTRKE